MSKLLALVPALALAALALLPSGCAVSRPFRGPGYSSRDGVTVDAPPGGLVVALTEGVLDRSRRRPFDRAIRDVDRGMASQPGLVGYALRKELFGSRVWTMSVWESEEALRRFVRSGLHRDAMQRGGEATLEFRYHSFRAQPGEFPVPWERAIGLLEAEGGPGYGG
ncbi:MAG: antibiotic biosynthesis monooxygenase [Planctomycetota bacterium]